MAVLDIYIAYIVDWDRFIQVLYLGRAPRTKETLPDFREKCRVTRHSRVFRGLTGSQRTPGFRGVTRLASSKDLNLEYSSRVTRGHRNQEFSSDIRAKSLGGRMQMSTF